jgi:hypothetical protein
VENEYSNIWWYLCRYQFWIIGGQPATSWFAVYPINRIDIYSGGWAMKILESMAQASVKGNPCGEYRAVVVSGELGAIVNIEQPIKGKWFNASGWYLSTLLENQADDISIDYGQQWSIDSGMHDIIKEAAIYCAGQLLSEART